MKQDDNVFCFNSCEVESECGGGRELHKYIFSYNEFISGQLLRYSETSFP